MDKLIAAGDFNGAAKVAEGRLGLKPKDDGSLPDVVFVPANVLDHLDAAEAWQLSGDNERALAHFDAAEQALKDVETEAMVASAGRTGGSVLINDTVLSYKPSPAESVLINYTKALCFWQKGDIENTRVELNRADDRTRRAVERYKKELEEAQKQMNEKRQQASFSNPQLTNQIAQNFPEMTQWEPYSEFVVPSATYLEALFLSREGDGSDIEKAQNLYRRVLGIVGHNHRAGMPTAPGEVQTGGTLRTIVPT